MGSIKVFGSETEAGGLGQKWLAHSSDGCDNGVRAVIWQGKAPLLEIVGGTDSRRIFVRGKSCLMEFLVLTNQAL